MPVTVGKRGQLRLDGVAGVAQDASRRDRDGRIGAAERSGRRVGGVVGDDRGNGARILQVLHLDDEAAGAAIREGDLAGDRAGFVIAVQASVVLGPGRVRASSVARTTSAETPGEVRAPPKTAAPTSYWPGDARPAR